MPQMWTYFWCLNTKLFSIMTCWNKEVFSIISYHLLVVIQNHATDVDLLPMSEHKVVQHQDLLEQWSSSRNDIPPIGGRTKSRHRCGLTDDAWTISCSASWPAGTMDLFSIMTYRRLVVTQNHATDTDLLMMPENRIVQHHDLMEQSTCSALWRTTYWWWLKIMPQMWTYWWCLNTKLFSIMTCWNDGLAQHYDIPPTGGHTRSCHRCGLTDDAWTQSCSVSWPAVTMKLFSIMTYHQLVVIQNHATDVDLLVMPEHKAVQHHDLLEQWTCSALWPTTYWWSY